MLRRILVGATLCAAFLASTAPALADCQTLERAHQIDDGLEARLGFEMIRLDGDEARRFLAEFPPAPVVEHADVIFKAGSANATVLVFDGPCGGYRTAIDTSLAVVLTAYRVARQ